MGGGAELSTSFRPRTHNTRARTNNRFSVKNGAQKKKKKEARSTRRRRSHAARDNTARAAKDSLSNGVWHFFNR
jgi:hypothetical protein